MKRLLLFLSLLSLIPGIKGQEFDPFGLGDNAILYQCHQCLQIFNTQNELDQHEIDHLLFAGLDIDDIDLSAFDKPLSSFNNSVSAHQVFASPAAPAHASPTAQIPVIDQSITKGSRLDLASSQASAQRNACIICGAIFKEESLLRQHMKKHNNDTLVASAAPKKSSKINPLTHPTDSDQTQQNIKQQGTQLLLPTVDTNESFQLAPIIPADHEQPKSTTEEEFAQITEGARAAGNHRRRAAIVAHKMITRKDISEEEEEEENGDDENYSADHENQDDNQPMVSAKNTTDKKSFQCSECGKTFTRNFTCSEHIRKKHSRIKKITEEYQCLFPGCTRSFDTKQGLEIHQRREHGTTLYDGNQVPSEKLQPMQNENGSFNCPYPDIKNPLKRCPYINKALFLIEQHLPKHTGEKNFQCSECKDFFTKDCNCLRHIESMHDGDAKVIQLGIVKAHKCLFPDCTRSFDTAHGLVNHHRQEHNQKTS